MQRQPVACTGSPSRAAAARPVQQRPVLCSVIPLNAAVTRPEESWHELLIYCVCEAILRHFRLTIRNFIQLPVHQK